MTDGKAHDMGNFIHKENGAVSDAVENNFEFPDNLEEFGYSFNAKGELRDRDGNPFTFKVKENHHYNQKRYEALGQIMDDHVYHLLEEAGLKRIYMPENAPREVGQSFIFASEDALSNPDKLLVLIHGSGVVKAGQWARRLIINDGLDVGTQLPYIKRGMDEGYGILVLNTNLNTYVCNGVKIPIEGHRNAEEHGISVWDEIISKSPAKAILIVAHSYGGIVTTETAIQREKDFVKRVTAIAFTDSIHSMVMEEAPQAVTHFYVQAARNWISSEEPLDTPIPLKGTGVDAPRVSAGNSKHEWTSCSSIESVFQFFKEKIAGSAIQASPGGREDDGTGTVAGSPEGTTMTPVVNVAEQAVEASEETLDTAVERPQDKATEHMAEKDIDVVEMPGDKEITAEDKEIMAEDKEIMAEDKEITAEDKEITSAEDKEIMAEDKEITAAEDKEITAEDKEITSAEDKEIMAKDKEITAAEDKEITAEDKEITAEDKEITAAEDKEVTTEDKEITAKDKEITARDKAITAEDKEITAEDKEITAEDKEITADETSEMTAVEMTSEADREEEMAVSTSEPLQENTETMETGDGVEETMEVSDSETKESAIGGDVMEQQEEMSVGLDEKIDVAHSVVRTHERTSEDVPKSEL